MKLLSFSHRGRESFGALTSKGVAVLGGAETQCLRAALGQSINELRKQVEVAADFIPVNEIIWRQPIRDPEKIICVGLNYRAHAEEAKVKTAEKPSLFIRFPSAQVGHEEPIMCPSVSAAFDFEGELAVIIGKPGRHIPVSDAFKYVAGYSCFAENSVRDFQRHSRQATAGKNFEKSGAFGPWIVTADEISDPSKLTLVTRLNGAEVQRTSTGDLIFSIPELISYISSFTRLLVGDVIVTGTPSGVGSARTPPLWMKAGDTLEVDISEIGVLRNRVIDEQ